MKSLKETINESIISEAKQAKYFLLVKTDDTGKNTEEVYFKVNFESVTLAKAVFDTFASKLNKKLRDGGIDFNDANHMTSEFRRVLDKCGLSSTSNFKPSGSNVLVSLQLLNSDYSYKKSGSDLEFTI